jgi:ferredoxin-NADP reductase
VTIGVAFLVVATLTEVVRALVVGSDIGSMLQFAYLSFPLVFFAGFMLSEPLTLPPRRWQQLVVAALAGMLIALPSPTWISLSPQLALVVANVVAFAFGQRRGVRLELVSSRELAPGTREFTFRPLRPVRFHAGQYLELDLPHRGVDSRGRRRVFSISSAPTDEALSVAMSMTEKTSSFKSALATLPPGSRVHATAIAGDFTLPHAEVPVLLVAGGIGITPFASQLADDAGRDVTVVYASGSRELPYADVLERSGARVVLVAPERPDVLPSGWTYAGPDRISRELLERHVPDAASRRAFVSGPPSLVSDVARMLRSLGARRVTTDYFTGY